MFTSGTTCSFLLSEHFSVFFSCVVWVSTVSGHLSCSTSHLRFIDNKADACSLYPHSPHHTLWGSAALHPSLHPSIHVIWTVLAAKQRGCLGRVGPIPGYAQPLVHSCTSKKKGRWNMTTWLRFYWGKRCLKAENSGMSLQFCSMRDFITCRV